MKATVLLTSCLIVFAFYNQAQTVTDYDGNIYHTVNIGSQVWLQENLRVTHYNNGDLIPNVANTSSWPGLSSGARCYYNNDSATWDPVYGALYNWYAVSNNNLCPQGWHIPSDAEWTTAENYLGGSSVAGGKMKEAGFEHWNSPNTGATNESGFTGLPGGMLSTTYTFQTIRENGLWWTASSYNSSYAWSRYLWYLFAGVDRNPTPKTIGLSVRCIKDIGVGFGDAKDLGRITIYPEPACNMVTIDGEDIQDATLKIYDIEGKVWLEKTLSANKEDIEIVTLPKGVYLVKLSSEKWSFQRKIIKN
jgi:uncharacterized protein (TIGR02145 family)